MKQKNKKKLKKTKKNLKKSSPFEYFHRIPLCVLSSSLKDALLNGFHFEFSEGGRLG